MKMKNSCKIITATVLLIILFSGHLSAQKLFAQADDKKVYPMSGTFDSDTKTDMENALSVSEKIVLTNPRLIARFASRFLAATEQKWFPLSYGFGVSFLNGGLKARASFTQKGKMNFVITDCTTHLPESIQKAIPGEYIRWAVNNAIEIKEDDTVYYQVVFENEKNYTTLKFTSDGVGKIQQLNKMPAK